MQTTPTQDIELGRAAEELQKNIMFMMLMERMESRYIGEWKDSQDVTVREALHAKTCALADIATELRIRVDAGTRAKIELSTKHVDR